MFPLLKELGIWVTQRWGASGMGRSLAVLAVNSGQTAQRRKRRAGARASPLRSELWNPGNGAGAVCPPAPVKEQHLHCGDVAVHAVGVEAALGGAGGVVGINDRKHLRSGSGIGESGEGVIRSAGAGSGEEGAFGCGTI